MFRDSHRPPSHRAVANAPCSTPFPLDSCRPRAVSSFVMRGRRAFGGLPLFGTAAAGVVIGHWLSYQVAVPDGHLRHHVLLTSGHGHWLMVVKVATALALAG